MTQIYKPRASFLKVLLCSFAALLIGMVHPFTLPFQVMSVMPLIVSLAAVPLYVAGGIIPLMILMFSAVGMSFLGLGTKLALVSLPAYAAPVVVMLSVIRRKQPFFRQMTAALVAGLTSAGVSVVLASAVFGSDMIAQAVEAMRPTIDLVFPMLWASYEPMFASAGVTMNYGEFVALYNEAVALMQSACELSLVGNVLTGSAITAIAGILWGNWMLAKRGEATSENFVGLADWNLPHNMTIGLLLTLVVGLLLKDSEIHGALIAWNAVVSLAQLAFIVQALAAMDRRLKGGGASKGRRGFMVALPIVCGVMGGTGIFSFLAILGAVSALMGRKGVVTQWMNKNHENMDGEDR